MEQPDTLPLLVPAQRKPHNDALRQSPRLRAMLSRLCGDLAAAVAAGSAGADERARLHGWLRADYFPWAGGVMLSLSLTARSQLASAIAHIGRLDAALIDSHGARAAAIAADLEVAGTEFITSAVSDVAGTE